MAFTHALATNNYGPAKLIVSASAANGTHTTIASALSDASSGDTIFIRPGTYTENLTLVAGVNLTAYTCDAQFSDSQTSNVNVVGKMTASYSGTVSISGIRFVTNSDFLLVVSGASATYLNLYNCYLQGSNNTAISQTASSAKLFLFNCEVDVSTTGIAHFAVSAGGFIVINSQLTNSGASSTANTLSSSANAGFSFSKCNLAITTSNTALFTAQWCAFNATLTLNSTNTHGFDDCVINSGTNAAISVGTGAACTVTNLTVVSSNTNPITGLGTITYGVINFNGTSAINTTTQTKNACQLGQYNASGQPCFAAETTSNKTNVTGDGTTYTVLFDTALFDQASNYATGTGIFTAPIAGKYLFTCAISIANLGAGHTSAIIDITTSGGTVEILRVNPANELTGGEITYSGSCIVSLTASQTARIQVTVSNSTKTVTVVGGGPNSYFSGTLLC